MRRDLLLVALLLLAACALNYEEAIKRSQGSLESRPTESFPGQAYYDGSWHLEGE
jgi:hypothetical protein